MELTLPLYISILCVRGKKGIGKRNSSRKDTGCSKQKDSVTFKLLHMVFKNAPAWYLLINCLKAGDRWICKVWHGSKGQEGKQRREV